MGEEAGGRMAGKSSNRARRRHLPNTVEQLPEWERELLDKKLDPMRAEITKLNREYLAQKSRPKKKKMPKVQMAHKKGQSPLQSHGA
jgi:hypothetical protein